ncbi:LEF-8 [Homarus gammarus nudivirus]|uniref:DNA-directed RNA polymerase n=1 Tax=Homarus gammarus nudivirus TaxID=2509616 RepID=A0A411HB40_9VIRU|nr:LEF-8 [Homarus gammarus nudivirus]QBB28621.1 LEF-8 [Homarus gammarus nudivirus]
MDHLTAFANILEYNSKFAEYLLFKCPCYTEAYKDFSTLCIENKSYLACIVIKKEHISKILHLKLPIMFGSLIDYSIRGKKIQENYNQMGCLYLDGCLKQMHNFISNNLTPGHLYTNKKEDTEIFKVNVESKDFTLHLKYKPNGEIDASIKDIKFEKKRQLERKLTDAKTNLDYNSQYSDLQPPKRKKQKTKTQRTYDKLTTEYEVTNMNVEDKSDSTTWVQILNDYSFNAIENNRDVNFTQEEYVELFKAYLKYAPKLDDLSNKINRTITYILHRGLTSNIDICFTNDKELKNLSQKITNMYKNGNMYFTLTQTLNLESKLVKGYRSIFQNPEAQKLGLIAALSSTIKRSVSDSIINSKALMYPIDGFHYTCPIDSREMKGAGENVMLSQLVIIPIGIDVNKIVQFIIDNEQELTKKSGTDDIIMKCVINSLLQPYTVAKSNLLKFKETFPTISLMIFCDHLIINTAGYNQMKYSVKYKCFMSTFEFQKIWPDAFDDYHPHLAYNNCALYLPETAELGLPAKLIVANANVRGRCTEITNVAELILFLHTNGASNAAIIHRLEPSDSKAIVSFDGVLHKKDYKIIIPIKLKDPQLRYLDIGTLGHTDDIPAIVQEIHKAFNPIEDKTEAFGMTLRDIIIDPDDTKENILKILYNLYENDYRNEFIDTKKCKITESDNPLLTNNESTPEQIIYDNKRHNLKCYIRKNQDIQDEYRKTIGFTFDKPHPPHMYINVAFGDMGGGTNEDGIIIDKKLTTHGPKKLISQTLNITYRDSKPEKKKKDTIVTYTKIGTVVDGHVVFGCISSNYKLDFNKTKNTSIQETFIPPYTHNYMISVENAVGFKKYIGSTFLPQTCSINIHYSFVVPIGVGTKLSTGHGQKGIVCKIVDLSSIKGYTKEGKIVHPLMLLSPTSVLGRTMSNQVMSMHLQKDRAFTENGVLISPHGVNVHNIDPSIKTKISEVKNDLMTTENGFLSNSLSHTMKVLTDQRSKKDKHRMHYVYQLCALQGVYVNMLSFNPQIQSQSA